nr:MAG TPA: hypothetical protein [Caudoviricetes sp.]
MVRRRAPGMSLPSFLQKVRFSDFPVMFFYLIREG